LTRIRRWLAGLAPKLTRAALFGVPLAALATFFAWEVPRISPITYRQTDALPIFLGLRALVSGNDPYALSVGAQAYRLTVGSPGLVSLDHAAQFSFHYPLPPALLYLPMSLFSSLEVAAFVARALTVGVYLAALLLLARRYAPDARPLTMAWLLFWGIAWWPFLAVILPIIQPTGIVVAALAFCLLAVGTRRWFWAGFALFFALLKPQDALPVLAVLIVWGALRAEARWRLLAGFGAIAVVPVALSFLWRPDWLLAWVDAIITLPAHIQKYYQNPLASLSQALGPAGVLVWLLAGALALAWLALVVWGALRPMKEARGLAAEGRAWRLRHEARLRGLGRRPHGVGTLHNNWPLGASGHEVGSADAPPRYRRWLRSQPAEWVAWRHAPGGESLGSADAAPEARAPGAPPIRQHGGWRSTQAWRLGGGFRRGLNCQLFSRARDPQWGMAVGSALGLALLPRTGGYEIAIGLIPWFYAWQWAGEIAQHWVRLLARGVLAALWLACGVLAYIDHGYASSVVFGVGLLLALGALMVIAPGMSTDIAEDEERLRASAPVAIPVPEPHL